MKLKVQNKLDNFFKQENLKIAFGKWCLASVLWGMKCESSDKTWRELVLLSICTLSTVTLIPVRGRTGFCVKQNHVVGKSYSFRQF